MKKRKILQRAFSVGIIAAVILTGSATAKNDSITWKTKKAERGYITTFRAHGKIITKIRTARRVPVKIMDADKVGYYTLSHRKNRYILIEKYRGTCVNDYGDGETYVNGQAYYISYHKTPRHKYGQKYVTYCIHSNDNAPDGVKARADFHIKSVGGSAKK